MLCVIKADDLVLGSFRSEWEQFFALIREHGAAASTGVIGKPSEAALRKDPAAGRWLEPYVADERFEFWNHGYSHTHAEFFASLAQQVASIQRTDELLRDALGVRTRIFGPPFNRYGPQLYEACATTGIEILYHGDSDQLPYCIPAASFTACEIKDAGNDPDGATYRRKFERLRTQGAPYFVLQVHPWRWSAGRHGGFEQFGGILKFLVDHGVRFATAATLRARHPATRSDLAQRISERALAWIERAGPDHPRLRHPFFASRYQRGLRDWSERIEGLGFTEQVAGGPLAALDVGCGVGQWAAAFALRNPRSSVIAVDPGAEFLGVLSHAVAGTSLQPRVHVVEARAEDYEHRAEPVDRVFNNGVLMYADHETVLRKIAGASRIGSLQYVSYHTDRHYVRKILDALEVEGNRAAAVRWARIHASISLCNVGLGSPWAREWCLPKDRLLDLYGIAGFDVVATPQVWDAEDRLYDGAETFVEFVFEKRAEFDTAVRDHVEAQPVLGDAVGRMVAAGLPWTALDIIQSAGGWRTRADLKTAFLLASTKARELLPVFEMDLEDVELDPFAVAVYLFEIGHTARALELLRGIPGPASIFLQCIGQRQRRRIAEAYDLALTHCRAAPEEPLFWCALFYTGSVHPDPAALGQAVECWRRLHPRAPGAAAQAAVPAAAG